MNHPTHEHGPHESDDHAYADEQIGENDSGAALDAHGPSVARVASSVHRLRSLEDETSFREPLGALKNALPIQDMCLIRRRIIA
jgi:hypothetical protein